MQTYNLILPALAELLTASAAYQKEKPERPQHRPSSSSAPPLLNFWACPLLQHTERNWRLDPRLPQRRRTSHIGTSNHFDRCARSLPALCDWFEFLTETPKGSPSPQWLRRRAYHRDGIVLTLLDICAASFVGSNFELAWLACRLRQTALILCNECSN